MMAILRILSIRETFLPGGEAWTIVGDWRGVKPRKDRRDSLHRYTVSGLRFQRLNALTWRSQSKLQCRLDPFAVFAGQILQPIHPFGFRILNFTAVLPP